jgi:hypothetical protein
MVMSGSTTVTGIVEPAVLTVFHLEHWERPVPWEQKPNAGRLITMGILILVAWEISQKDIRVPLVILNIIPPHQIARLT